MTYDVPVKVVGMGPFPLPGEKRRWRKAQEAARRRLALAEATERSTDPTDQDS